MADDYRNTESVYKGMVLNGDTYHKVNGMWYRTDTLMEVSRDTWHMLRAEMGKPVQVKIENLHLKKKKDLIE